MKRALDGADEVFPQTLSASLEISFATQDVKPTSQRIPVGVREFQLCCLLGQEIQT
jgi:hypothetical protein